jgi:hypothetical protein
MKDIAASIVAWLASLWLVIASVAATLWLGATLLKYAKSPAVAVSGAYLVCQNNTQWIVFNYDSVGYSAVVINPQDSTEQQLCLINKSTE